MNKTKYSNPITIKKVKLLLNHLKHSSYIQNVYIFSMINNQPSWGLVASLPTYLLNNKTKPQYKACTTSPP